MLTRKQLKTNARQAMKQAKPSVVWVTLALVAVMLVLEVLSWSLNGYFEAYQAMYDSFLAGELVFVEPAGATGFAWVLTAAIEIISMVLGVGYVLYCMRINRRIKAGFGDLLDGFGVFFRAVWVNILPSAIVGLWSFVYAIPVSIAIVLVNDVWPLAAGLPLLIPMVMAYYSYSLTTYLVLDNPQRTCFQCLAMSRQVMRGHRWELFKLDLSFLGWALLCVIPFVSLWVQPYMGVTRVAWYEMVMDGYFQENGQPTTDIPVYTQPDSAVTGQEQQEESGDE